MCIVGCLVQHDETAQYPNEATRYSTPLNGPVGAGDQCRAQQVDDGVAAHHDRRTPCSTPTMPSRPSCRRTCRRRVPARRPRGRRVGRRARPGCRAHSRRCDPNGRGDPAGPRGLRDLPVRRARLRRPGAGRRRLEDRQRRRRHAALGGRGPPMVSETGAEPYVAYGACAPVSRSAGGEEASGRTAGSRVAQQRRGDRHRPAGVDLVVDEQDRPVAWPSSAARSSSGTVSARQTVASRCALLCRRAPGPSGVA